MCEEGEVVSDLPVGDTDVEASADMAPEVPSPAHSPPCSTQGCSLEEGGG